ncbi:unnamed protein product [Rhizophagus irregularis]|nr:unnamed protein product [Rhizophagus irregularis]
MEKNQDLIRWLSSSEEQKEPSFVRCLRFGRLPKNENSKIHVYGLPKNENLKIKICKWAFKEQKPKIKIYNSDGFLKNKNPKIKIYSGFGWASDLWKKRNQDSFDVSDGLLKNRKKQRFFQWISKRSRFVSIYEYMNHVIVKL